MNIHKLSSLVGLFASAASLAAQPGGNCPTAPGSAYGIVGFQCANCGFKNESGQRGSYTFFAEPVITQLDRMAAVSSTRPLYIIDGVVQGSPQLGDVIEAVDGHPITTQAGADLFASPPPGTHSLTVRRGRERETLDFSVPASCDSPGVRIRGTPRLSAFSSRADSLRYLGDTVYIRGDGVYRGAGGEARAEGTGASMGRGVATAGSSPTVGKFGFAVECGSSCSMRRRPTGDSYYKYDSYPRIIEIRGHSAADRVGLRLGDLIVKVEGRSILDDDVLHESEGKDRLHMTLRRDGKDIDVVLAVVR